MTPDLVKSTESNELELNYSAIEDILNERHKESKLIKYYINNFPKFDLDENGEEKKHECLIDTLIDVAHLKDGVGFGELALINDAPRSATIVCIKDTHLATLDKEDFKNIMAKVVRRRYANMIKFMQGFSIFEDMTRIALEKLALFMK